MIYIVDDDPRIRDALHAMFQATGLCSEGFASATEFTERFDVDSPGCLLLDVCMPGMSGLELLRWLKDRKASIPVLMLSGLADISIAVEAMKNGAVDFTEKPFNARALLAVVKKYLAENEQSSQEDLAVLRSRLRRLSDREGVVLDRVMQGQSSKVIAAELDVSPRTIDVHRSNIMKKLGVRNAAALVRLALYARSRGLMD